MAHDIQYCHSQQLNFWKKIFFYFFNQINSTTINGAKHLFKIKYHPKSPVEQSEATLQYPVSVSGVIFGNKVQF